MTPLLRLASLFLAALFVHSCTEPLTVDSGTSATWKLAWTTNVDVKCQSGSDREIASRSRFIGTTTFRIVRPSDDAREEFHAQDIVTTMTSANVTLHANCDPGSHDDPVVVSQPGSGGQWSIAATVLARPGIDSLRIEIRGTVAPAVVRMRMSNGEDVTTTVIPEIIRPFSITVPYTSTRTLVDGYANAPDGSSISQFIATTTYTPD